jgi:hypothetical protein
MFFHDILKIVRFGMVCLMHRGTMANNPSAPGFAGKGVCYILPASMLLSRSPGLPVHDMMAARCIGQIHPWLSNPDSTGDI